MMYSFYLSNMTSPVLLGHVLFCCTRIQSRMIAEVEDILAPGTMPVSKVAVLYPRSAWLWDNASGGVYGPVGPHGTEDQGATAMDYMAVIAGLFRVIQQQNNIQVDLIDEDSLTAEVLAHHSALSGLHIVDRSLMISTFFACN